MNDIFRALAHPARRTIVQRLARGGMTVRPLTEDLGLTKPAVSKHLQVLEQAGLIARRQSGRQHHLSLRRSALQPASEWLAAFWTDAFDELETLLDDERDQPS